MRGSCRRGYREPESTKIINLHGLFPGALHVVLRFGRERSGYVGRGCPEKLDCRIDQISDLPFLCQIHGRQFRRPNDSQHRVQGFQWEAVSEQWKSWAKGRGISV